MKKLKFVIAAVATIIGLGGALANTEIHRNRLQTLNISSINGATSPNISFTQKNIFWVCTVGSTPCYYTLNPVTHRYDVPSSTLGNFHFIP